MDQQHLKLLSYNIQAGMSTSKYAHYVTRSWQHVMPAPSRMDNLDGIAEVLLDYDIVGLQEVDTGSLRSGFVNQAKYLAQRSGFSHVFDQNNRRIGVISQHSNAVLSRICPSHINEHKLPGVPGRGVLEVAFGKDKNALRLFIVHLALGKRSRLRQIVFLANLVGNYNHVILMGDLNCCSISQEMDLLLELTHFNEQPKTDLHTFPSWRPNRQLDHILVSPSIEIKQISVLEHTFSDHLPIAIEVQLPAQACASNVKNLSNCCGF